MGRSPVMPEGWVQPAPSAPRTAVGTVDSPLQAAVDRRGVVTPWSGAWSLDWWIRSEERWHVPSRERDTAVSQRLVDGMPVVETSMRVPSGQVVHRVWTAVQGTTEVAVVEVENRSKVPVAVAFALRPTGAGIGAVDLVDRTVTIDGRPALALPRPPSRSTRTAGDADPADVLLADGGDERWAGAVRSRRRLAAGAFVFPLAHTASVRVALPMEAAPAGWDVDLGGLPDAERVVNGWKAHASPPGALRLELPDPSLTEASVRDRVALLVTRDRVDGRTVLGDAAAVAALDRFGHHEFARRLLAEVLEGQRLNGSFGRRGEPDATAAALRAVAEHWRLTDDESIPEATFGAVAKAAHRLGRADPWFDAAQRAAAEVLDAAGQPDAAERCRQRTTAGDPAEQWARAGIDGPAAGLLALRDRLVADGGPGIALVPEWPDDWLGQGVEVHDAPTRWGSLSFAVRWHGPRPAVLWDLGARLPVELVAPGLDPSWSTMEASGEALLAPVEPAGGLPKVVAPLEQGTPAASAPDSGTFR